MPGLHAKKVTCTFCDDEPVHVAGKVRLCAKHGEVARSVGRDLAGAAARAAGAAFEAKAPTAFATGRALFAAFKAANDHNRRDETQPIEGEVIDAEPRR